MAALESLLVRGRKYSVEEGKQFVNTQPLKQEQRLTEVSFLMWASELFHLAC